MNNVFDIWYSAEKLAIAHQIRLEIGREKGLKTTVYKYSSSHHLAMMNDDSMMTPNDEYYDQGLIIEEKFRTKKHHRWS